MKYAEDKERSGELLRLVVPLMAQQPAAYHPVSYTLWYEHVAGCNAPLSRELDSASSEGRAIDDDLAYSLYSRHIAGREAQAAERLRSGLDALLRRLYEYALGASSQADTYGISLAQCGERLRDAADPEAIEAIVRVLIADTERMRGSVSALRRQVDAGAEELRQLRRALEQAQEEALTDALTGLKNRRSFDLQVREALATSAQGACVLILADVDRFKSINDRYGHLFGDRVLKTVAQTIEACGGRHAVAARVGGEEFAILLPGASVEQGEQVAQSVLERIAASRIRRIDSHESVGSVTVSIGVARHRAGESAESLYGRADQALYLSKQGGRNRVTVAAG